MISLEGIKFYAATTLGNAEMAKYVADRLKAEGWKQTYEWTTHGQVKDVERLPEVARLEMQGVMDADVVMIMLPGERGTHCELGMALVLGKKVFLYSEDLKPFDEKKTCSFYWLDEVEVFFGTINRFIEHVIGSVKLSEAI